MGPGNESGYVRAQAYYPLYELPDQWVTASEGYRATTIIVRTALDPTALMPASKRRFTEQGDQPVYDVHTMHEIASASMASQRFPMILLGAFAALALLSASVGIYGVISYSVTQRAHEMGIRMALGAQKGDIFQMVIGQGRRLAVAGLALGIAAASIFTRVLSSFSHLLYRVGASDPLTFAAVSLVLTGAAVLACYIPARACNKRGPDGGVALRVKR